MSGYIKNNLIVDFDINDIDENTFSVKSKHKWSGTKFNSIEINDYGLNQYDVGLSTDLKNSKTLNSEYFTLDRIGEPNQNGTISYSNYPLTIVDSPTIGKYLKSTGGYLINPFKLHEYGIEYIPRKFNNGFTFELTLYVDDTTFTGTTSNSNFFLSLGTRAEDKFSNTYSGNTSYITSEGATLDNSYKVYDILNLKENTQYLENITTFFETENLYIKNVDQKDFIFEDINDDTFKLVYNNTLLILDTDYTVDLRTKTITLLNIDIKTTDTLTINYYKQIDDTNLVNINLSEIDNSAGNQEYGIENNIIGFRFDKFGKIGYKKVDQNGNIEEYYSDNQAVYENWNHIVITFQPNQTYSENNTEIDDECPLTNPREGTLKIFVNGLLYMKKDDFIEPQFNPYPIDRSKQVGVPYNISWGGGFPGLKHSYNFNGTDDQVPFELNPNNENLIIQNNFDGYFKGGIQKLRIYDNNFTFSNVKYNYDFESDYYNIEYNKGGRLIHINNYIV